jgi:hypothetical protein
MKSSQSGTRLTIELLRAALRWNETRFASPNDAPDSGILGWRRGDNRSVEWWIKPKTWQDIFVPHGLDPVEAARTLKHLGLLRVQDSRNLQVVVKVRDTTARVYAIDGAPLAEWRPVTDKRYGGYEATQLEHVRGGTAIIPNPINGLSNDTLNLADKLEAATSLALDEASAILRLEAQIDDRTFQMILRAKSGIINTVLTNQVRVDEAKLRHQHSDGLPALLERIAAVLKGE